MFSDSDHFVLAAHQMKLALRSLREAIRHLKAAERQFRHPPCVPEGVDIDTRVLVEQLRALLSVQISTLTQQIEQDFAAQETYFQLCRLAKLVRMLERSQSKRQTPPDEPSDKCEP